MTRLAVFACFVLTLCTGARGEAEDAPRKAPPFARHSPVIDVREVVKMALDAARTLSPQRAEALSKRARLAGLVPQLKLAARRGLQQDLSATATVDTDRTNTSQGDDLSLEASLTFQFDRLVFAPEEVRLLAVERSLVADRRKLIEDVIGLFFKRERVLTQLAQTPEDPELHVALAELEALLDAFTNNGFRAALENATIEAAQ